jgi:pimeloyl-ACP methyl ester carboxylesterase
MAHFVLVHGAWHDGSAYEPIAQRLETHGHTAYAPTQAGHGENVDKDVSHADCTQSIVDFIVETELEDIILLGHSYGGTIIPKVAEAIPDRIKRLVFQNAFVLEDGNSLMDECPPNYRELFNQLADEGEDDASMPVMPFEIWRERFVNDASLEVARWTYDQLSPQPFQPFTDELDMEEFYSLDIPASYINATEDTGLPKNPEWCWHPRMSSRLGNFRLVQMPGSHEVCYTDPDGLADTIMKAGRD